MMLADIASRHNIEVPNGSRSMQRQRRVLAELLGCDRTADALIARFGSIGRIVAAPAFAIGALQCVDPCAVAKVHALKKAVAHATRDGLAAGPIFLSQRRLVSYLRVAMVHLPQEQLRVLFLDTARRLMADDLIHQGTADRVALPTRTIAITALELDASYIILAHNHPSGDHALSAADIGATSQLQASIEALGIRVLDHIVVGRHGTSSMRAMGLL